MWNKKGDAMASRGAGSTTLISRASTVQGDISFSGDLEIQGQVKGSIFAEAGTEAAVRIVEGGSVCGTIEAPSVLINGTVEGDVHCSGQLELAEKAVVTGNVHYQLIEMVKGAQVNGKLIYAAEPAPQPVKTAPVDLKPVENKAAHSG